MCGTPYSSRRISTFSAAHRAVDNDRIRANRFMDGSYIEQNSAWRAKAFRRAVDPSKLARRSHERRRKRGVRKGEKDHGTEAIETNRADSHGLEGPECIRR